jgi:hypothetical protein
MKSRKPKSAEIKILNNFFAEDASSLFPNCLDAMAFAHQITSDEDADILVYDISNDIKYVVMIIIDKTEDVVNKTIEEFCIDLLNNKIELAKEIEVLC